MLREEGRSGRNGNDSGFVLINEEEEVNEEAGEERTATATTKTRKRTDGEKRGLRSVCDPVARVNDRPCGGRVGLLPARRRSAAGGRARGATAREGHAHDHVAGAIRGMLNRHAGRTYGMRPRISRDGNRGELGEATRREARTWSPRISRRTRERRRAREVRETRRSRNRDSTLPAESRDQIVRVGLGLGAARISI